MAAPKPMLAGEVDIATLNFPVYASPKLDGVRAMIVDGQVLSRSGKKIPNSHVQGTIGGLPMLNGLDGEIVVGSATAPNVIQDTVSGVMTKAGRPEFTYWVFDFWTDLTAQFSDRYHILNQHEELLATHTGVKLLKQFVIHTQQELFAYEDFCLEQGYEGIMTRNPKGVYKHGRSTPKQQYLLKLKRFKDSEAVVVGACELMHNSNENVPDAFGYASRSTHKENLVPMNTLGAFLVRDIHSGVEFSIGTGFTATERKQFWEKHLTGTLSGLFVKYKYFERGVKELPRFPTFVCVRPTEDMPNVAIS
mgnify:CR=1 FL=1